MKSITSNNSVQNRIVQTVLFHKSKKTRNENKIQWSSFDNNGILYGFSNKLQKRKNRICELYKGNVGYSIGTVESSVSVPTRVSYTYSFMVDGVSYEGTEKEYGIGQEEDKIIGRQFVVIYQQSDPNNSDLNFDFLIESDIDFQEFEDEYQNNPPPPDFPNKCK